MSRRHQLRGIKFCAQCGGGFDGFKGMEVRGPYCSPGCLEAARAADRQHRSDLVSGVVPTGDDPLPGGTVSKAVREVA